MSLLRARALGFLLAAALAAGAGCNFDSLDPVDPPRIGAMNAEPSQIFAGSTVLLTVAVTAPASRAMTFEWTATGGELVGPQGPGIQWTAPATPGGYRLDVRVTDETGLFDDGRLFVAVVEPEAPDPGNPSDPIILSLTATPVVLEVTGDQSDTATVSVAAMDPDGDVLEYEWLMGIGAGDAEGAETSWSPIPGLCCTQEYPIAVIVHDGRGRSTWATVVVDVVVN